MGAITKNPLNGGLEDACWEGYEAIGFKDQGGHKVPNCVPKTAAEAFRHALTARNVLARYVASMDETAMEFPTEEALQHYLKEHPGADKSNHSVKKDEGSSGHEDMTPKPGKAEQELGGEIQQWQGPGTPAVNHVGSYLSAGHPVSKKMVHQAIREMERNKAQADKDGAAHADKVISGLKKLVGDTSGEKKPTREQLENQGKAPIRLQIRPHTYHGQKGYAVNGKDSLGRSVRLFTKTEQGAKDMIALYKKYQGQQHRLTDEAQRAFEKEMLEIFDRDDQAAKAKG